MSAREKSCIEPHPVVVTGLGTVAAGALGRSATAALFADGRGAPLAEIDRSAGYHREGIQGSRLAAQVDDGELAEWISPREARRMSRPSKLAVAATRMAMTDAGLEPRPAEPCDTAVVSSTSFGPSAFTEEILGQVLRVSPEAASPFLFTESVANASAAQVALTLKAHGPNVTVTQREAGPLIALARAAGEIALGRRERAVVLAVDEINDLLHAALDRYRALARPAADGREIARPFDRRRDGFILAEGATAVVLETADSARHRGATPLAAIVAHGGAFDPEASPASWGRRPAALATGLERTLERAGLEPSSFDRIVAGAAGTRAGDRLEGLVLQRVFADVPPVLVPKAVTGEHGGGLLAGAVLAAAGEPFGATPGFSQPDSEIGLTPHGGGSLAAPDRVLVSALAAGGAAAWTVLERSDG